MCSEQSVPFLHPVPLLPAEKSSVYRTSARPKPELVGAALRETALMRGC